MLKPVLFSAAALAALLLGGAWHASNQLLYPAHPCIPEHYVYCGTPAEAGLDYEGFRVQAADGVDLEGWFIPAGTPERTIVFIHGHGGTLQEGLRYGPALNQAGFNLAAFSLRGNLGSETPYTMGDRERLDARAVVDHVIDERGATSVGVFGFSMGAVVAIGAMADDPRIDAGIFNSPFADLDRQLAHSIHAETGLPAFPLVPLVRWIGALRSGADYDDAAAVANIGRIRQRPIFLIHGRGDPIVPFELGQLVFEASTAPKESWFPSIDAHVYEWNADRAQAESRVVDFFSRHLAPATRPSS